MYTRPTLLWFKMVLAFCRFQAEENGTVVPDDKDTIKRLASDPMFKLDRGDVDVSKAKKDAHPRINKLAQIQGLIFTTLKCPLFERGCYSYNMKTGPSYMA